MTNQRILLHKKVINDAQKQEILSKFWSLTNVFDPSNPDLAEEGATGNNLYKSLIVRLEEKSSFYKFNWVCS